MSRILSQLGARTSRWLRRSEKEVSGLALRRWTRANTGPSHARLKIAEAVLWVIAVCSIGYCSVAYAGAAVHQFRQRELLNSASLPGRSSHAALDAQNSGSDTVARVAAATNDPFLRNGLLGTIEIPRLDISSVVEEGVDDSTLWEAVGHIPGTALPGQNGNSALAAHRDTYFRGLGDVQVGDLVVFHSPYANFRYRVESMKIVDAGATDALPDSATPTLSLITCYPFHYIGPARQRFVATARADFASQ